MINFYLLYKNEIIIFVDSIDCGIVALGCCNSPKCQKMGNKKTFTIILVLCGVIQGAIESYFRISAKQSALTHDYDPRIIGMDECVSEL